MAHGAYERVGGVDIRLDPNGDCIARRVDRDCGALDQPVLSQQLGGAPALVDDVATAPHAGNGAARALQPDGESVAGSVRGHLRNVINQNAIAKFLAKQIGELTTETRPIEFEKKPMRLSDSKTFPWRRNLPPFVCKHTIFNYVATYNNYEKRFAEFLDNLDDVARFASLGTTESESGVAFKIDYLKPSGAIGFYYPDFAVVQNVEGNEVHWIIETKGRVWEDTPVKDAAMD